MKNSCLMCGKFYRSTGEENPTFCKEFSMKAITYRSQCFYPSTDFKTRQQNAFSKKEKLIYNSESSSPYFETLVLFMFLSFYSFVYFSI